MDLRRAARSLHQAKPGLAFWRLFFVEGTLLPGSNDLRHLSSRLTPPFVFLLFGTLCPRQRSVGLEGAGGPVGFEPAAGKRGVILAACFSASGLVTAVDRTVLVVSSSRRPAPVNRLSSALGTLLAH